MSLSPGSQLVWSLLFAICLMFGLWSVQLRTRDAGIVDVGWASSLGLLAIFYAATVDSPASPRPWLVGLIAAIWSFRLAIYLLRDRVLGKPEDGRYQKLRSGFGSRAPLFFFGFFQVQGLLAWLFSLPFWLAQHRSGPLDGWDFCGLSLWVIAFIGESLADAQLAQYRSNPLNCGKTCRLGLWKYSRHPNYFFESVVWWGFWLFACGSPWGWVTMYAPAMILYFLLRVTGSPLTEECAVKSKGDAYREYQRTTSAFVPWPPKS